MTDIPTEFALPGVLAEIARLTTVDVAIAFARKYGQHDLYIPKQLKRGHALARILGRQAALILCNRYGGDKIEVPAARTYLRWHEARRLRRTGATISEISRRLEISERQVWRLVNGIEAGCTAHEKAAEDEAVLCPACGHRHRGRSLRTIDMRQFSLFPEGEILQAD